MHFMLAHFRRRIKLLFEKDNFWQKSAEHNMQQQSKSRFIIDLNTAPRVFTVDNFLTKDECLHMIGRGRSAGMERAVVAGESDGVISKGRTNNVAWLEHFTDETMKAVALRVASLVGIPLHYAEKFQLIHYGLDEQYKPHFDAFDPNTSSGKRNWEGGGQRLITALGYLNTPQKGGATIFPKLKLSVPAEAGKLVVFHNCQAGSLTRDPLSLHGGAPVEAGDKWAFNLWFRAEARRKPQI
jgi:prolyl 4-hydroxylase